MFMHIKKTYAMAAAALMAALSVVLLLIGVYIPVNTLFFTAMAAYLAGYTINKYGIKYGGAQLVVCALLDMFFIPDKLNWIVYLCLSGYIFLVKSFSSVGTASGTGRRRCACSSSVTVFCLI